MAKKASTSSRKSKVSARSKKVKSASSPVQAQPDVAANAGAEVQDQFVWHRKDLLGLDELSSAEIQHILDTAESFKEVSTRSIKKVPALHGKVVGLLFFENSTRTRMSFELAASRLSADTVLFTSSGSSVEAFPTRS